MSGPALSRRQVLAGAGGLGLLGVGGVVALRAADDPAPARPGATRVSGTPASEVDADVALRWADHYLSIVTSSGIPVPAVSEMIAELGVVLHVAAHGRGDARPLTEVGDGALRQLVLPPASDAHPALVANAAFSWLLGRRYQDSAGPALVAASRDAEAVAASYPKRLRDPARRAGEALGGAVLDWYLTHLAPTGVTPVPRAAPPGGGDWVATPPDFDQPVLPYWGNRATLVLRAGSDEKAPPPPPFSTEPGSACHDLAVEVRDTVAGLTPDQEALAKHWADGKWSVSPPGHWLRIACERLRDRDASLDLAAETILRLGLGQHDAFVSCWWGKYHYNVLRPLTYIRRHLDEPGWLSPVTTPCFPEYTSGHATQSAAGAAVLASVLGDGPFTDATNADLPPRSFSSYVEASQEAAVSRLYGGIHFSNANEAGLTCGGRIGERVAALDLRA